ncbi:MAG: HAMP domain-containing protein [Burkholderiales bacterium]|nr:MAG: HAMP domain-containing protein [Burkholderiales bacterium]
MSAAKPGWWFDTLGKRLFLLLWVTLVLSHVLGFWLAHSRAGDPGRREGGGMPASGWLLPRLPPVGGLHDMPRVGPSLRAPHDAPQKPAAAATASMEGRGSEGEAHFFNQPDEPGPGTSSPMPPDGAFREPPHEPPSLWLDYAARVLVMGLAAWLGSRWLTAPMRRLSQASQELGRALRQGGELPVLDEQQGPREVRLLARVFNDMAQGLHAQFEQRSLMMAAVSHDLRTPLTRLRMRLESLRSDPIAERCVNDVRDIDAMIASVLDVMNEERRQEVRQSADLMAMVQAMADDMQEAGHPVTADGEAVTCHVQPVAFKRVLDNLVSNALRYGHSAAIRVSGPSMVGPCQVRITIDDEGPGIPEDQLEQVFKPFVRLETSRSRDTGGVGLGLYIARELVLRHGGQLRLLNRAEGGLRAEIVLPMN